MPADDHRRFRLPTTWDEYAKPKDEFYNKHVVAHEEWIFLILIEKQQ